MKNENATDKSRLSMVGKRQKEGQETLTAHDAAYHWLAFPQLARARCLVVGLSPPDRGRITGGSKLTSNHLRSECKAVGEVPGTLTHTRCKLSKELCSVMNPPTPVRQPPNFGGLVFG